MSGTSVREPVRLQVVQLAARRSKGSLGRGIAAASSKSYTNLQDMLQKGRTMVKVCHPTGWNLMCRSKCCPLCSTARALLVLGLQLTPPPPSSSSMCARAQPALLGAPVLFSREVLAMAGQLAALSGPELHLTCSLTAHNSSCFLTCA